MKGYKADVRYYKVGNGPVNYRVHFIGSGYESVTYLEFKGVTDEDVFDLAKEWYVKTHQTFHYCNEFEREEWIEPTNPVFPISIEYCELEPDTEECSDSQLISYLADAAVMKANELYDMYRKSGHRGHQEYYMGIASISDTLDEVKLRYLALGIPNENLTALSIAYQKIVHLLLKMGDVDRKIRDNWEKMVTQYEGV